MARYTPPMTKTAPKTAQTEVPTEARTTPLDQAAEAIRADARRAPRTYARDVEVPGGGE